MQRAKQLLAGICLASIVAITQAEGFQLKSPDIQAGKPMNKSLEFTGFGCDGDNTSPQLSWSGAPEGTKSFAVTVYDPDAPTGSGWWHWVIIDIPANVHELAKDAGDLENGKPPKGSRQIRTDYGSLGFGGACPPKGDEAHHYHFKAFALDVEKLQLPENPTAALVGYNLNAHALATSEIITTYQR